MELNFLRTCPLCCKERDTDLFTMKDGQCDLCTRKAERIKEGLFVPQKARSAAGPSKANRLRKVHFAAQEMLAEWKRNRRRELNAQGIVWGEEARIIAEEEPEVRERLGLT